MTKAEIRAEVYRRLEESLAAPVVFEATEVNASIDEAYEELAEATEWCELVSDFEIAANTLYHALPPITLGDQGDARVISVREIFNPVTSRWLEWRTVDELDRGHPRWERVEGSPLYVFARGQNHLGFWPVTPTPVVVHLHYTAIPPALADADTPGFPQELQVGIVEYALYDLLCQEAEIGKGMKFWARYKAREEDLARFVRNQVSERRKAFTGGVDAYPNRG